MISILPHFASLRIHFTKIEWNQAHFHFPADENSEELLKINTPEFLFQFTRLPREIAIRLLLHFMQSKCIKMH